MQYLGEAGISSYCKEAIIKLIHSGDKIKVELAPGGGHAIRLIKQ